MRQSHSPTGEENSGSEFIFLFFCEEVTVEGWASKHTAFWFSPFPLILTYKSAMWLHICISKFAHQKPCSQTSNKMVLFMVSVKTYFYFNFKLQTGVICGQRALESVLQKVALRCIQGIFFHSWRMLVLLFTVHAVQGTFEVDFTKF